MGGNVTFMVDNEPMQGGPIHSYDITDTLNYISNITNISKNKLYNNILGSAYKNDISNDIDIAIDIKEIGYEELRDYLKTSYDWVHANDGLKVINLLVPIQGKQSKKILGDACNGYVQVDLMFGNSDWMKFSYHSPGKKSKYPGKYRTILLMCVALLKTEFLDKDEQGEIIAKIGRVFDLNNGLLVQKRIRLPKKSGKGYLNKMKLANDEEWNSKYAQIQPNELDLMDPNKAAEFLFGENVKEKDLQSFEQVVKLVRKMPKSDQYQIDKLYHMKTGHFIDETLPS